MLDSIPVTLFVGTVLGFLAGIGVGGGSLLILWLTLVINLDHFTASIINLLFFLPTAIIASFFRWRQGTLNIKNILPAIIAGCIAAGLSYSFRTRLNLEILKLLFGILLIGTGLREILYHPKKKERP